MRKSEQPYLFHGMTISICPECMASIPGKIIIKNNSIYLIKQCNLHGEFECLLEENAEWYLKRKEYNKPGTESKIQTSINKGCPLDCGLCPDHDQHTCIGLLEITKNCDLNCPICYAGSKNDVSFMKMEQIKKMMDFFQDAEAGNAEIIQISGGEPSTHPDIIEIIETARNKGFKYVMLNTNGLRIASDRAFVKELSRFETGFEVYLQFDGFEKETYLHFRNQDLTSIKQKAVENLVKHGVPVTLVSTIEKGINEHEIGSIIDFGLKTPCIRGINFQPVAYFGRRDKNTKLPPSNRITITGILQKIEDQSDGIIKFNDFVPLPCNVDSIAVAYMFKENGVFVPISRNIKLSSYLPVIDNTFYMDAEELTKNLNDCQSDKICKCGSFLKNIQRFLPANYIIKSIKEQKTFIDENTFRISVTMFQDLYNFEMHAMKKECVHVITDDFKRIPFSAYNMIHRNKYHEN